MTTRVTARPLIAAGTPQLRRLNAAMLAAGLSALALLYSTQALLPEIGRDFGVGATAASLTVSVATGVLAVAVLPMATLAERLGRVRVMVAGLAVASASVVLSSLATTFVELLLLRAVDGLALASVVAVAVGHIGSEVEPSAAGSAIGIYVSGTSIGGLVGRLVPAGVSDLASWRWCMVALGVIGALGTLTLARLSGPAARPATSVRLSHAVRVHLRDPGIRSLCAIALLLMGGFVATYNYLTFRLSGEPFSLSPSAVGLVFLAYLAGTGSSTAAARLASRHGRRPVLIGSVVLVVAGLLVTLSDALPAVLVGLVVFTAGYFGAHSVASGWTSARAGSYKSHAAAMYMTTYYLGSSLGGTAIGVAWTHGAWPATVAAVCGCYAAAVLVAWRLRD